MLHILIFLALHGGTMETGVAPHYAPTLMRRVAIRRGIEPAACMISRPDLAIGSWVFVHGVKTGTTLRCQVVDVSAPKDYARHKRTGRIAELAWEVTRALCGSTTEPARACPVLVVDYD